MWRRFAPEARLCRSTVQMTGSPSQRRNEFIATGAERRHTRLIDIAQALKQIKPAIGLGGRAARNEKVVAVCRHGEATVAFSNVGCDGRG
jgi:hypothetical protein